MNGVRIAPSDRVVLGFIGLGQQALSDFKGFAACPGVQVAACCDVDTMKTERFRRRVAEWQASKGMNQRCDQYEFYEDLLERKDIDAIEVATPPLACFGYHSFLSIRKRRILPETVGLHDLRRLGYGKSRT